MTDCFSNFFYLLLHIIVSCFYCSLAWSCFTLFCKPSNVQCCYFFPSLKCSSFNDRRNWFYVILWNPILVVNLMTFICSKISLANYHFFHTTFGNLITTSAHELISSLGMEFFLLIAIFSLLHYINISFLLVFQYMQYELMRFLVLGILKSNYLMWLLRWIYIMVLFPGVSGLMYFDSILMDHLMLS